MRREPGDDRRRRRGVTGALSMRVVLALGASIGSTASVALPMAYQAREARREQAAAAATAGVEVLGTTTVTTDGVPAQRTEGVTWASIETPDSSRPLHGATVSGPGWIRIELDGVVRVDFRIGDGPVVTDTEAPWELPSSGPIDPATLAEDDTRVVATVSYSDRRSEVRQADFEVSPG